jgi:hypothetical protein
MANTRKKKNYMHTLQLENGIAITQAQKQQAVYEHFLNHTGTYVPRHCSLNFSNLGWELVDLSIAFLEQEIMEVIMAAPKEKGPGPDGFVDLFFSSTCVLIKKDIIKAVHNFYTMNQQNLHMLNQAYVVLIPKILNPQRIADYRLISLIHSFAKNNLKYLGSKTKS